MGIRKGADLDHICEHLEINRSHHLVFSLSVRQHLPVSSCIVSDIVATGKGEPTNKERTSWSKVLWQARKPVVGHK